MKNNFKQTILGLILVILLVLISDPFMWWMPPMGEMVVLILLTVAVCVWAGLVFKESSGDERELVHQGAAGRAAYLAGLGLLTVALLVQGFNHQIDGWITLTLGVMVVVKLGARFYLERNK